MSSAAELQSGKGAGDENFPVASFLIAPKNRPPVMAFYNFVRAADDVADHATAAPDEKLALLEQFRASLVGESDTVPEGVVIHQLRKGFKLRDRLLRPATVVVSKGAAK